MRKALFFLKHYLKSSSKHGLHSPFVYQLVNDCIYTKETNGLDHIFDFYDDLKSSDEEIFGTDLGQGRTTKVSVAKLAKRSVAQNFESRLLNRLIKYHDAARVLELGCNIGKSSAAMAHSNPSSKITTVDGNEALVKYANNCFERLNLDNVRGVHSSFDEFFKHTESKYDMIFIDGDHRYKPTLDNYGQAKKALRGQGPIVLHDIYWSNGMEKAWGEIKRDQAATVTIDLFFFGLVYLRGGQEKQHFNIRFPKGLVLF